MKKFWKKKFERKNKKLENREGERMCGLYICILGGGAYLLPGASLFLSEFYSYKIQFFPYFSGSPPGIALKSCISLQLRQFETYGK